MKTFFKLTAWTALALALLGVILGVLTAVGAHQGWFGMNEVSWVVGDEQVVPTTMNAGQVAGLAAVLALCFGVVFLVVGLIVPFSLMLVGGAVALGLVVALPFLGLALVGGAIPYLVVAALVWWMWRLAHPAPGSSVGQAQPPSEPPQS